MRTTASLLETDATIKAAVDQRQMLVAATGARNIGRSLVEPEWLAGDEESGDLLAVLRGARRPYDEACEQQGAERLEEDAERKQSAF